MLQWKEEKKKKWQQQKSGKESHIKRHRHTKKNGKPKKNFVILSPRREKVSPREFKLCTGWVFAGCETWTVFFRLLSLPLYWNWIMPTLCKQCTSQYITESNQAICSDKCENNKNDISFVLVWFVVRHLFRWKIYIEEMEVFRWLFCVLFGKRKYRAPMELRHLFSRWNQPWTKEVSTVFFFVCVPSCQYRLCT